MFVSHVERRRRHVLSEVDAVFRSGLSRPRWHRELLGRAYALYSLLRSVAVPQGRHVPLQLTVGSHIPRSLHRALRTRGVSSGVVHSAAEVRRLADAVISERWRQMSGRQVVLWFDNFYRQHFGHNPQHIGLQHLNATVVSILMLPFGLPAHGGLARVSDLRPRSRQAVAAVASYFGVFMQQLEAITRTSLTVDQFRVPLDLYRDAVSPVSWCPLLLTGRAVQRNDALVELLSMFVTVRDHCRYPLPLLVDLDIYYRLLKLAYGQHTQYWDVAGLLRTMPPLYGVWHPYKYVVTMVYRQLQPYFCFLKNGTVPSDFRCSAVVDIRATELFLAAVLVIPCGDRQALEQVVHRATVAVEAQANRVLALERDIRHEEGVLARAQREFDRRLEQRRQKKQAARPLRHSRLGDVQINPARLQTLRQRHSKAVMELVRLRTEKSRLYSLWLLVEEYAPACLLLGYLVRDCHWAQRTLGSGGSAKKVLLVTLLMLLGLCEQPHAVEYVRTLCVGLVNWGDWNDAVPGYCYAEEANEASLSRLGSQCARYPRHLDVPAVMDLFLAFVKPSSAGSRTLRSHTPTESFRAQVLSNFRHIVRSASVSAVTFVPVRSQRSPLLFAEPSWPETWFLPRPLHIPPDTSYLQKLFFYEIYLLVRQRQPMADTVRAALDQYVTPRSDEDQRLSEAEVAQLLAVPPPRF